MTEPHASDPQAEIARLTSALESLRAAQVDYWTDVVAAPDAELQRHRDEIIALHETVSWRVTRPLRALRGGE